MRTTRFSITSSEGFITIGKFTYPNLKFDPFVLSEDGLDFEINPHGGNKGRGERVVGIAEKEAGLAHRAVTDDQEFEHVVEVLVGGVLLP